MKPIGGPPVHLASTLLEDSDVNFSFQSQSSSSSQPTRRDRAQTSRFTSWKYKTQSSLDSLRVHSVFLCASSPISWPNLEKPSSGTLQTQWRLQKELNTPPQHLRLVCWASLAYFARRCPRIFDLYHYILIPLTLCWNVVLWPVFRAFFDR